MILSVRRKAGLGDNFFFDNASESINHWYKVSIRNEKATCYPTGVRGLDFSMPEAGKIHHNMLEQTRRKISFSSEFCPLSYLSSVLEPTEWKRKGDSIKMARYKVQKPRSHQRPSFFSMLQLPTEVKPAVSSKETARNETINLTDIDSEVNQSAPQSATKNSFLGDFQSVGKAPSVANAYFVVSNTSAGFHHVSLDSKGCPVKCDCAWFEKLHLCAHLVAVGYYVVFITHHQKVST